MSTNENRSSTTSVRLTPEAFEALDAVAYDGERRSDTVMRAIDALEREENLPAAVRNALAEEQRRARED